MFCPISIKNIAIDMLINHCICDKKIRVFLIFNVNCAVKLNVFREFIAPNFDASIANLAVPAI